MLIPRGTSHLASASGSQWLFSGGAPGGSGLPALVLSLSGGFLQVLPASLLPLPGDPVHCFVSSRPRQLLILAPFLSLLEVENFFCEGADNKYLGLCGS